MPGDELSLALSYRPPYDWDAMLAFFSRRAIPGMEAVSGDTYTRTVSIGPDTGTVAVRPSVGDALEARIRFPRSSALPAIVARVQRMFDLATDTAPIEAHLSQDPLLASIVAARRGLRVPGSWDGFEMAVRAILGQQVTVAAAVTLAGRLVSLYGRPLAHPTEVLSHVFPDASALTSIDGTRLGMPRNRVETLAAVARAVDADAGFFRTGVDLDDVVRRLRGVKGVGDWTAHYIALRHMREPDAFPAGDVALMRAVESAQGARPSPKDLLLRAERWRPWRAYAAQHLWTSLASHGGGPSGAARR